MPSNPTAQTSHDHWSDHIALWRASKLTRIEYCRQHDLQLNSFIYQINRSLESRPKALTLIPVKVGVPSAGGGVVLHGPKGWSLTMAPDVSTVWLGELLGRLS